MKYLFFSYDSKAKEIQAESMDEAKSQVKGHGYLVADVGEFV